MSIIFLKNSTTSNIEEFERQKKSFDSKIFIVYNEDKLPSENVKVDDFSLDITLGKSWNENYSYNDKGLFLIEDQKITILPHTSVVVAIREYIKMPYNKFGIVLSTGSLFLQQGIQIPSAKVEPGYSGLLKLRLVNSSNDKVTLYQNQKIASVVFFETNHTPNFIEAINSESTNIPHKGRLKKVMTWIKQQGWAQGLQLCLVIVGIITIILAILNFGYGVYKDVNEDASTSSQSSPNR